MEKAKVYFTDFRCRPGKNNLQKLQKLCKKAGIEQINFEGKFVAIKMHFGELGCLASLRPQYVKAVADLVKELGGRPFLTDCNTLYPGSRKHALEHMDCANLNGYNTVTTGCQIIIGDGLRGTDEVEVPVKNGEYVEKAKIGRAIMDADVFISLAHFKGHEMTGFGGAIKNIGMGCGSRAGKMEQHSSGKPKVDESKCKNCHRCAQECGSDAITYEDNVAHIHEDLCKGCGRCIGACAFDAIETVEWDANENWIARWPNTPRLSARIARVSTSIWSWTFRRTATAMLKTMRLSCQTSACSLPLTRSPWTRPVPMPA